MKPSRDLEKRFLETHIQELFMKVFMKKKKNQEKNQDQM